MIGQIHDELLFEVPEDELKSLTKIVVSEMESVMELDIPIKVDYGFGKNWFDAH